MPDQETNSHTSRYSRSGQEREPDRDAEDQRNAVIARQEEARITTDLIERVGLGVDELAALLLLEEVKGFGPQKFKELHVAGLTPAEVLEQPDKVPTKGKRGKGFQDAIALLGERDREISRRRAVRQIVRAFENESRIVTYRSPHYPRSVFESNNPVPVLYARGALDILGQHHVVACVGSRRIRSPYDVRHRAFSEFAVREGFAIASGFATGADRIGHEAAWQSAGQTILVMPSGLDRPFPPENRELWTHLLTYKGAVIVSEFHFGTKAASLTLRKRNKLIVAFARGVLMSQSSANGGAMNAYKFALEQRKPVATFAPDQTPETAGNAQIERGPPPRRARSSGPSDAFVAPTTVFPSEENAPVHWEVWLQQLLSST